MAMPQSTRHAARGYKILKSLLAKTFLIILLDEDSLWLSFRRETHSEAVVLKTCNLDSLNYFIDSETRE